MMSRRTAPPQKKVAKVQSRGTAHGRRAAGYHRNRLCVATSWAASSEARAASTPNAAFHGRSLKRKGKGKKEGRKEGRKENQGRAEIVLAGT